MTTVLNLQKKINIELAALRQFSRELVDSVTEVDDRDFTVALVSDRRIKDLNSLFRGKDAVTDVLSFPHEKDEFDQQNNTLGDIVIAVPQAERQAVENDLELTGEIKQLILHGLLHLCG